MAFGEVLAEQTVGVLVAPALPGAVRVAEVHGHIGGHGEVVVGGQFGAAVPGQGVHQPGGQGLHVVGQGGHDAGGVLAGDPDEHEVTGTPFNQRRDPAVVGPGDQVPFPVAGHVPSGRARPGRWPGQAGRGWTQRHGSARGPARPWRPS